MTTPDPTARTPYNTPLPGATTSSTTPPGLPTRPGDETEATSPLSAPEKAKPPVLTIVAVGLAALALLIGVVGIGVGVSASARNIQLQEQVDALRAQQAEVDGALAALDERTGTSLAEYLEGLDARLSDAEAVASGAGSRADSAMTRAGYAEDYAFSVNSRLDAVVECVNEYMKTVGDSGGGYYRYYFCY